MHQIEQGADVEIVFKIGFLGRGQGIFLILCYKYVNAVEIHAFKTEEQQGFGRFLCHVGPFGVHATG